MDIEHGVTLSLTGKEPLLTAVFNPALNLSSHVYEIALLNLFTYNSIPNITSANNNFYFYNYLNDVEILDKECTYLLPSESLLYIEGRLVNAEGKGKATDIELTNNCALHLFSEIQYRLNNQIIDHVRNPGIAVLMKGYASFTPGEANSLQNAGWGTRIELKELVDNDGRFNFCIPLKMILGFAEDYKKIIINARHELVLIRSRQDINCIVSETADTKSKIVLENMHWEMPHVQVSEKQQISLWNILKNDISLRLAFRHWDLIESIAPEINSWTWQIKFNTALETASYVILAFQSNRNSITADSSVFDKINISDLKVYLNSSKFPEENFAVDFDTKNTAQAFEMYANFQSLYYGDSGVRRRGNPLMNRTEFQNCPIFFIDCSHQDETLKSSIVDMKIEIEAKKAFAKNTIAYCLVIHDSVIEMTPSSNQVAKSTQIHSWKWKKEHIDTGVSDSPYLLRTLREGCTSNDHTHGTADTPGTAVLAVEWR
ncbi:uncharacterized protein LOC126184463 [Schistocerca cancellata]|uniref:uncharacterized protein LOC126184463 n=1 Tax=Schistocerca cancellata TaxID=274614 RepID=UPI0021177829|nr:uncharacterized protein LOC126184463 [Schistocerca cancellata]